MPEKIDTINEIKTLMKSISPFNDEPVECVQWVESDKVIANDYNPNSVAPPEMELLHTSRKKEASGEYSRNERSNNESHRKRAATNAVNASRI